MPYRKTYYKKPVKRKVTVKKLGERFRKNYKSGLYSAVIGMKDKTVNGYTKTRCYLDLYGKTFQFEVSDSKKNDKGVVAWLKVTKMK